MTDNNKLNKHSKKRNTGLLYEFLIRYISNALIEHNDKSANSAIKLLKTHFKKGTELYKEFRLFNAIIKTTVDSASVASSILFETKSHARKYNFEKLDREKSLLIRDINHKLNDNNFFTRRIPEYKTYATIQTLLNDWRNDSPDSLERIAIYENEINKWLITPKYINELEDHKSPNIDALVVKLMTEKLNKKYSNILNEEQKNIVKNYAFAIEYGDQKNLKESLVKIMIETKISLEEYINKGSEKSSYVLEKLNKAQKLLIEDLNIYNKEENNGINDDIVIKCLKYSQLKQEILDEDKQKNE